MQETNKKVVVIVPFYKDTFSAYEGIALEQCFKILSDYPVIAIKPDHLTLPAGIKKYFDTVVSFDDHFFANIAGYNALMLSDVFYKAFLNYEFMLIYQLDAFVFEDKLNYWCEQGYDYIGAPWLKDGEHPDIIKTIKSNFLYYRHTRNDVHINGEPSKYQFENKVGNGGFSLRRVKKFYDLCVERKADINGYLTQGGHHYNEDRFWSIEVNRKKKILNIPGYKIGVQFSVEFAPKRAFTLNNNQLPFGCHAWDRNLDFWRPVFEKLNYAI